MSPVDLFAEGPKCVAAGAFLVVQCAVGLSG